MYKNSPGSRNQSTENQSSILQTILKKNIEVKFYKPSPGYIPEKKHVRDELYIIIAGKTDFILEGLRTVCLPGDLLFVPAHSSHEFLHSSNDFSAWVIFFN